MFACRHAARHKEQWNAQEMEDSMRRSDDSTEALIGVEPDQLNPELMQSDPQGSGDYQTNSRSSSVSLSLTEQYSIASCSYPPLSLAELEGLADELEFRAPSLQDSQQLQDLDSVVVKD